MSFFFPSFFPVTLVGLQQGRCSFLLNVLHPSLDVEGRFSLLFHVHVFAVPVGLFCRFRSESVGFGVQARPL